jgi:hypothetical protein
MGCLIPIFCFLCWFTLAIVCILLFFNAWSRDCLSLLNYEPFCHFLIHKTYSDLDIKIDRGIKHPIANRKSNNVIRKGEMIFVVHNVFLKVIVKIQWSNSVMKWQTTHKNGRCRYTGNINVRWNRRTNQEWAM